MDDGKRKTQSQLSIVMQEEERASHCGSLATSSMKLTRHLADAFPMAIRKLLLPASVFWYSKMRRSSGRLA